MCAFPFLSVSECPSAHVRAVCEARTSVARLSLRIIAAARASPAAFKRIAQASPVTAVCAVKTIVQVPFWILCGIVYLLVGFVLCAARSLWHAMRYVAIPFTPLLFHSLERTPQNL